jgi:hypothetical protein
LLISLVGLSFLVSTGPGVGLSLVSEVEAVGGECGVFVVSMEKLIESGVCWKMAEIVEVYFGSVLAFQGKIIMLPFTEIFGAVGQ